MTDPKKEILQARLADAANLSMINLRKRLDVLGLDYTSELAIRETQVIESAYQAALKKLNDQDAKNSQDPYLTPERYPFMRGK